MASQRANVTKSAGLYTYLSELAAPEGAQVVADNVNIDELGVITPRRGLNDYGGALSESTERVQQIMEYKQRILRHYNNTIEFDNGSGNFTAFSGNFSEVEPGFRLKFQEANGNFYFTSSDGIKKISARRASQFTSNPDYITNAGAPKAVDIRGKIQPSSAGFLPPESKVAYKVLFGYTDKNNNLILGTPSTRQVITNTSKDMFTAESIFIDFIREEQVDAGPPETTRYLGKYFTLDSKDSSYYIWYNDAADGYDEPQTSDTLGATGIEVIITSSSTATDVANATANAIDAILGDKFEIDLDSINADISLTSTEEGDIGNPGQGTISSSDMTIETIQEGSVVTGTNSQVELNFIVPEGVTSEYFYQIYRTANVTVSEGITLNDIDPGEDCNLVIENPVTVSPGQFITVTDNTPSSFRDTGVPLYNNPISGQGLLQTNDRPPVAKDIENFSNYTFFSNTKTFHRYTFNMVSVDDFGSDQTNFIIGNEDGHVEYTFRGREEITNIYTGTVDNTSEISKEVTRITTGTVDETSETNASNPNSYFTFWSGNNEQQYYVWFDKGTGVDPAVSGATGIRIDLSAASGTANVSNIIRGPLGDLDDFDTELVASDTFDLLNVNIGFATDTDSPTGDPVTDIGTGWSFTTTQQGRASYIELFSAGNERKYYVWFDKGSNLDPQIENAIGVRVDLAGAGVTGTDNVSEYLAPALSLVDDFTVNEVGSLVEVTTVRNGEVTDTSTPTGNAANDIGTGWDIQIDQQGFGEDAATNYVLWSDSASVGQAIEDTARSLVSVINQDVDSPVNAFYLSGANDLPGRILLENKNLEDKPFYVAVNNTGTIGDNISGEFNPNIPVKKEITGITQSGDNTQITINDHGYLDGDLVYVSAPNNDPVISGAFEISAATTNTFEIEVQTVTASFTDAFAFIGSQESDNSDAPNRLYYSKLGQPEAVPIANYVNIGEKDKPIERILSLRDNLFVLKEDGVYIVSGAPPFSIRLLDNTSNIIAPDSAKILNNQIFSLNENGIVTINETGVSLISRPIEDLILDITTNESYDVRLKAFGVSYESEKAYFLWLPTNVTDEVATQAYRYNLYERTWTRWTVPATSGYASEKNRLYVGDGERNYLLQERKNNDRTDYADRNFTLGIPDDAISGKTIRLSSSNQVIVGDVLVQVQQVTVNSFNSFLAKLELDPEVSKIIVSADAGTDTFTATDHDLANDDPVLLEGETYYVINATANTFQLSTETSGSPIELEGTEDVVNRLFTNYEAKAGSNIATLLNNLNAKLISIGLNVTSHAFVNSDWDDLKTKYNDLIDELNSIGSGTRFKNYRKVTEFTTHESITTAKRDNLNEVDVLFEPLFLEGSVEVYKSIKVEVQWSPLHFGDPASQKQVSKGTVIMDQNNFTQATVSYSSDLSQDFVPIKVDGKGVGYWGSATWGQPDLYWGGNGNDVPIMNIIPREKQRCRYLNIKFEHGIAREGFRILGVTAIVRIVSDRAYR